MKRLNLEFFLLIAIYLLAGRLGLSFSISESAVVTPIWPPSGFAFIFLSLFGLHIAPAIFVGSFILNILNFLGAPEFSFFDHAMPSAFIALGSTVQTYLGVYFYNQYIKHEGLLRNVRKTLLFTMGIVPLVCIIGASVGTITLFISQNIALTALIDIWLTWWLGDMGGVIILFPLYVSWIHGTEDVFSFFNKKYAACITAMMLISFAVLSPFVLFRMEHHTAIILTFLLFPILAVISYAYRHYGGTTMTFIMSITALIGAATNRGPFHELSADDSFLYLTFFIWSISLTSLILATLANEKEELLRVDNAKTVFLSTISHEIRTPLNIIIGLTSILKAEKLDQRTGEYVDKISTSSDFLLSLINNVLDVAKIDTEKMSVNEKIFKSTSFFKRTKESFEALCMEQGITYRQNIDLNISTYLVGDEYRLMQIFNNLIGNALKFTEKGKIELNAHLYNIDGIKERIHFSIKDTGIGIDEERLDTIFHRFTQADSSITRKYGGSGLGLYLSNQLVELMGGKLEVKSKIDEGTEFSFFIDFKVPHPDEVNEIKEKSKLPDFSKMVFNKILVVDDSSDNLDLLKLYLKNHAIEVVSAVNGKEAVDEFKKGIYDVVILDIEMPVMDGLTALKEMQQYCFEKLLTRPLMIALTAYSLRSELERYRREGFDIVMTKPVRKKDLFLTLFRYESTKKAS